MRRVNLSIIFIFFLQFLAIDVFSTDGEVNHSPYDVVYNHIHFLKKGSYDELQSAASFDIPFCLSILFCNSLNLAPLPNFPCAILTSLNNCKMCNSERRLGINCPKFYSDTSPI